MLIRFILTCLLTAVTFGTVRGELYVYSDAQGSVHISHSPMDREGMRLISYYRSETRPRRDYSWSLIRYTREIADASKRYGVEEELIRAVIMAESDFDPYAVSEAGALGLMQLMPKTAERMGVEDCFDPIQNIDGGVRYLKLLHERFDDTRLAVAAYHAGENRVAAYGDIPPIPATRKYVDRVLQYYEDFKKAARKTRKIYRVVQPDGKILFTTSPVP